MRLSKKARQRAAKNTATEAAALSVMVQQLEAAGLISAARSTAIWRVLSKQYRPEDFNRANEVVATLMVAPWRIERHQYSIAEDRVLWPEHAVLDKRTGR